MAELRFNDRAGRYIDRRGRFVSIERVRATIDRVADGAAERMAQLSDAMLRGDLSLGAWESQMQRMIKDSHLGSAVIAHGGEQQMTPARYGSIGNALRSEYEYLRQFAQQIADGRQPLNGSLVNRSRLYGQAARATASRAYGQDQEARGFRFCKNQLRSGESCAGCRAESRKGAVPTGALVPVGSRRPCLRNCRCVLVYYRTAEEGAAA